MGEEGGKGDQEPHATALGEGVRETNPSHHEAERHRHRGNERGEGATVHHGRRAGGVRS